MIFDEATSALDPASEKVVQQALNRPGENRTTIAIAHRLSTIRSADNIVVLNRGSVVEQGTHDELLSSSNGAYRKLLAAQTLLHGEQISADTSSDAHSIDAEPIEELVKRKSSAATVPTELLSATERSNLGILKSLTSSLYEQRRHWPRFLILLICCIIGGTYCSFTQVLRGLESLW